MADRRRAGSTGTYPAAVAALGVAAVALAVALLPSGSLTLGRAGGLGLLAVLSIWVPLRIERKGGTQGFTMEEGVFVAMLFALPLGAVPPLMAIAALVGHAARWPGPAKVAFNMGQVAIWSTAATVVFHLVGSGTEVFDARSLLAALAAVITLNVVSLAAVAELFRRLSGRPWSLTYAEAWRVNAVTTLGNTSFGLVLGFIVRIDPFASVVAASLMIGLYLGYRGYVKVLDERRRTDALHAVTRSLLDVATDPGSVTRSLGKVAELLGGSAVELVVGAPDDLDRHLVVDGQPDVTDANEISDVARWVLASGEPVLGPSISAPLTQAGVVVGVLTVFERRGLEPWDATDVTLLATVAAETTAALENIRLLAVVEDERSRFEAESRKLNEVLAAASDGVALLETDGVLRVWNRAMEQVTGVSAAKAIGRPWWGALRLRDIHDADLAPDGAHVMTAALAGARVDDPVPLQVKLDGDGWRWLGCTFAPVVRGGTIDGTVLVARDVTAQRELELLKEDFLATVSHELRTPLTPLKGFISLLIARDDDVDRDQRRTMLRSMANQVERLERLVGDLLLAGGVETGAVTAGAVAFDLPTAVEHAVAAEAGRQLARVELALVPASAQVGRAALDRIVRALVSNALRHTSGPVRVELEPHDTEVEIRVHDQGEPIPVDQRERIFDRFHRVGDHLTRAAGGAGLGLSIARVLARRHGGDLTVDTTPGDGNTFTLRLPAARRESNGSPARATIA